MNVVKLAVADVHKGRNGATQIQQRVQLDGPFGAPKVSPTKQPQAQNELFYQFLFCDLVLFLKF